MVLYQTLSKKAVFLLGAGGGGGKLPSQTPLSHKRPFVQLGRHLTLTCAVLCGGETFAQQSTNQLCKHIILIVVQSISRLMHFCPLYSTLYSFTFPMQLNSLCQMDDDVPKAFFSSVKHKCGWMFLLLSCLSVF